MNTVRVGSMLLTLAVLVVGVTQTANAVYQHTVRARSEPDAVQTPPPGFEGTLPAEVPGGTVEAPASPSLPAPEIRQPVLQIPVRFIGEQRPGQLRASQLIGAPVMGDSGGQIANIADLVLDESYHVTAIVLSSGGVLGIGSHDVAVPRFGMEIEVVQNEPRVSVKLSKAEFEQAPEFQSLESGGFLSDSGWLRKKLDTLTMQEPIGSPQDG